MLSHSRHKALTNNNILICTNQFFGYDWPNNFLVKALTLHSGLCQIAEFAQEDMACFSDKKKIVFIKAGEKNINLSRNYIILHTKFLLVR